MSRVFDDLAAVRTACPLVHNITNFVVMNPTANALLACGASPVMAHAENEVEEMAAFAGALVLNIGTLAAAYGLLPGIAQQLSLRLRPRDVEIDVEEIKRK